MILFFVYGFVIILNSSFQINGIRRHHTNFLWWTRVSLIRHVFYQLLLRGKRIRENCVCGICFQKLGDFVPMGTLFFIFIFTFLFIVSGCLNTLHRIDLGGNLGSWRSRGGSLSLLGIFCCWWKLDWTNNPINRYFCWWLGGISS